MINVDTEFDEDGIPVKFVSVNGRYEIPFDEVFAFDWRDSRSADKKAAKMTDPVELFDGTDSIILVERIFVKTITK
jgi:hypothetical protein